MNHKIISIAFFTKDVKTIRKILQSVNITCKSITPDSNSDNAHTYKVMNLKSVDTSDVTQQQKDIVKKQCKWNISEEEIVKKIISNKVHYVV